MLERAGLVRRGYDGGRAMEVQLLEPPPDAAERTRELIERYRQQALERVDRIVRYAESGRCRQATIAEHFGEDPPAPCGACDRCAPPAGEPVAAGVEEAALPDDVAGTILNVVDALTWPLGKTGLAAMLCGSVAAPPSARRNGGFGALAGARPATVRRWLDRLVESGHLEPYESDDGFPLLRRGRSHDPPPTLAAAPPDPARAPADDPLFERLRAWRLERARAEDVPAFVVCSDRTLRALAAARPADLAALADVPGIGPAKLDRYGAELLDRVRQG
jgi:ATP-dependent DNA helicase RecQ